MKYYLIAGEPSGDLQASYLVKELAKADAEADFRCFGGDLMAKEGAIVVKHYRELAFMGVEQVILNIRTIFKNISFLYNLIFCMPEIPCQAKLLMEPTCSCTALK